MLRTQLFFIDKKKITVNKNFYINKFTINLQCYLPNYPASFPPIHRCRFNTEVDQHYLSCTLYMELSTIVRVMVLSCSYNEYTILLCSSSRITRLECAMLFGARRATVDTRQLRLPAIVRVHISFVQLLPAEAKYNVAFCNLVDLSASVPRKLNLPTSQTTSVVAPANVSLIWTIRVREVRGKSW